MNKVQLLKLPPFLIGKDAPEDNSRHWIIHTAPLLLGLIDPTEWRGTGKKAVIHCWPPAADKAVPPEKLKEVLDGMIAAWKSIMPGKRIPTVHNFAFRDGPEWPVDYLFAFDPKSEAMCFIYRFKFPRIVVAWPIKEELTAFHLDCEDREASAETVAWGKAFLAGMSKRTE